MRHWMIARGDSRGAMRPTLWILVLTLTASALAQDASPPAETRGRGPRGFGGPIVLQPDDVPAFPEPPVGFDRPRACPTTPDPAA